MQDPNSQGFYAPRNREEQQDWVDYVRRHPEDFDKVKCRNGIISMAAVRALPSNIQFVEEPSDALQMTAVKRDPRTVRFIKHPSQQVKLYLATNSPVCLAYVKNISEDVLQIMLDSLEHFTYSSKEFMYFVWTNLDPSLHTVQYADIFARHIPLSKAIDFITQLPLEIQHGIADTLLDVYPLLSPVLYQNLPEDMQTKDRYYKALTSGNNLPSEFLDFAKPEWLEDPNIAGAILANCDNEDIIRFSFSENIAESVWAHAVASRPSLAGQINQNKDKILVDAAEINPSIRSLLDVPAPPYSYVYATLEAGTHLYPKYTYIPPKYFIPLLDRFPDSFGDLFYLIGTKGECRLDYLNFARDLLPQETFKKIFKNPSWNAEELRRFPEFLASNPWILEYTSDFVTATYLRALDLNPDLYLAIEAVPRLRKSLREELRNHALYRKPSLALLVQTSKEDAFAYVCQNHPGYINKLYAYDEELTVKAIRSQQSLEFLKGIRNLNYELQNRLENEGYDLAEIGISTDSERRTSSFNKE